MPGRPVLGSLLSALATLEPGALAVPPTMAQMRGAFIQARVATGTWTQLSPWGKRSGQLLGGRGPRSGH